MVVTIRCKLLQCFGVPVTLSCVYKQYMYLNMDIHTHMRKREKFSIAETQSLSLTEK